jgi:MFS family permease
MTRTSPDASRSWIHRLPFYYGWVTVVVASLAMTATLPGRTHGLGLITEPLLADLQIADTLFARINLAASLLGAAFCLPVGWLIDRFGSRAVLTGVALALGGAVFGMAIVTGPWSLLVTLVLIRGLGQSALSIVSMAIVGKWFQRRLGIAMGVFSVLLTIGFIATLLGMGKAVEAYGWRTAWHSCGVLLVAGLAPLGWIFTRDTPHGVGLAGDEGEPAVRVAESAPLEASLGFALRSPAFWVFALGTSMFNLIWSAITLFNEWIMAEQGFDKEAAVQVLAILTGVGLVTNLGCGAIAGRRNLGKLLGIGLGVLAVSLGAFSRINSLPALRLYAVAMGLVGGVVMVVFFAAWRHLFGAAHLGRIQGAAQLISVLASASGPLVLAEWHHRQGSYGPAFQGLAVAVRALAMAALFVSPPEVDAASVALPLAPALGAEPAQD